MRLYRTLQVSARALCAHKVRAGLALASIAVSVGAVVIVSAIGNGAEREILRQTESMGTNLLVVRPAQVNSSAARKQIRGVVTTLTQADYEAISGLDQVAGAVPAFENTLTVKAQDRSMSIQLLGTTRLYLEVCRFQIEQGRFLDDEDNRRLNRVAVLGARVERELFAGGDAVGQEVRIRGVPFDVIGVLNAKGIQADGSDQDNQIVIPIRTAMRRVFNLTWLNPIFVSVRDPNRMSDAQLEIARLLRLRHRLETDGKLDDFQIQDKTKTLLTQRRVADSLTTLAVGLAGISLIVGGIGILAMMLMSVKERTSEIGLRMAIGARSRDILIQFLGESTLLAIGGWIAGLILGILGAFAVGYFAKWKIAIAPSMLITSFVTVLGAGAGFGTYPARKASLIPPIRALQVE
jgi:putative ABC transport system permease protein